jgi:hypothetical protein
MSKGDHENEVFNKFFSYFVAYNIVYNLYARLKKPSVDLSTWDSERAVKIKEIINNQMEFVFSIDNDIQLFINLLRNFTKEKWAKKSSEYINDSLERSYQNRNYSLIIRDVLRMLYKLRCNLFHGGKNMEAPNQQELMDISAIILKAFLIYFINRLNDMEFN